MRTRSLLVAVSLGSLVAAGLAGCGSTKKPQPASLQTFTPTINASVAWKADVGRSPKFDAGVGQFSPAVSGDSVFAASASGAVTRVSLADGRQIWRADVGAPIVAGVAVGSGASQGQSAVITAKGEIVVISAEGKVARQIPLGGVAHEIPALLGNTVVVRLADNRLAGWDIQTGTRRWVLQRSLPPLVLQGQSGMRSAAQAPEEATTGVLGSADLLVNLPGGRLMWVDASTGNVRWESQVVTPRGSNEVERIVDLLGAPTAQGADVCVAAYQTGVSCLTAEKGQRLWLRELAVMSAVAADARVVLVADDQSRIHALGRSDGKPLWSVDTLRLRNVGNPVAWGRAFWLTDRFGFLHAISKEDGRMMARVSLDGGAVSGAMRLTQRGLVIQTQGGQLLMIRSEG